jgi:DNA-binding transcriptional ArsR family regulator
MLNPACEQLRLEFQNNEAVCARVLTLFHLLSNKARFRIVCLLARGEFCVHEIAEVVGAGRLSNISQQLKMLTMAGVIVRRRDHNRILYTLRDERIRTMVEFLRVQFVESEQEAIV